MNYYLPSGRKCSFERWQKSWKSLEDRIVARTVTKSGFLISTVWLGLDHRFGKAKPLIFETMVFKVQRDGEHNGEDLDCDRYSTLAQAKAGHKKMVMKWRKI